MSTIVAVVSMNEGPYRQQSMIQFPELSSCRSFFSAALWHEKEKKFCHGPRIFFLSSDNLWCSCSFVNRKKIAHKQKMKRLEKSVSFVGKITFYSKINLAARNRVLLLATIRALHCEACDPESGEYMIDHLHNSRGIAHFVLAFLSHMLQVEAVCIIETQADSSILVVLRYDTCRLLTETPQLLTWTKAAYVPDTAHLHQAFPSIFPASFVRAPAVVEFRVSVISTISRQVPKVKVIFNDTYY